MCQFGVASFGEHGQHYVIARLYASLQDEKWGRLLFTRGGLTLIGENVPENTKNDFPVRKDFHCKNQVILRYKESELHTDSDKEIFIPQCVGEEFICSYF